MSIHKKYGIGSQHRTSKGNIATVLAHHAHSDEVVTIKINGEVKDVSIFDLAACTNVDSKPSKVIKVTRPPVTVGGGKYNSVYKSSIHGVPVLYPRWRAMIEKCYSGNMGASFAKWGAKGYIVCREWQNFQNFAQWVERQIGANKFELKITNGKTVFSPQNCYVVIK